MDIEDSKFPNTYREILEIWANSEPVHEMTSGTRAWLRTGKDPERAAGICGRHDIHSFLSEIRDSLEIVKRLGSKNVRIWGP